jgi:hypothetical protein
MPATRSAKRISAALAPDDIAVPVELPLLLPLRLLFVIREFVVVSGPLAAVVAGRVVSGVVVVGGDVSGAVVGRAPELVAGTRVVVVEDNGVVVDGVVVVVGVVVVGSKPQSAARGPVQPKPATQDALQLLPVCEHEGWGGKAPS